MAILISESFSIEAQKADFNSTTINGMTFHWRFHKEHLQCRVTAPTKGWVAIGFNTKDELSSTNLIMGSVEQDYVTIDDRFVVKPGDHKSITELGGSEAIVQRTGVEENGKTSISFSIPLSVNDKFHHNLVEGKEYYVLMAFSQEDDFQHHSIMRTTIKIRL
ncbi:MAG: DOMON domain-containing protein [Cyclobacteriaceae bacterium]